MKRNNIFPLFLGMGLILFSFALSMCKKESKSCKPAPEQQTSSKKKQGFLVKSAAGKFTDEQTYELIRAFKAQAGKNSRSTGWTGDVALDIAEYELEASINFDFDSYGGPDMLDVSLDVSTYPFTIDAADPANLSISSSELNDIYADLQARFNAMISSTLKISAIDIVTYADTDTGQGFFEVTASVMKPNLSGLLYKCTANVWATSQQYANCDWSEVNSFFTCGGNQYPWSPPYGVRADFQAEMNCRDLGYIGCDNGYYFTGITTVNITAGSSYSFLYEGPTVNTLAYCNATASTLLSGATYNTMLANAKSFVLNDCANSSLSLVDNSTIVTSHGVALSFNGYMYWKMSFQKGTRRCKPHIEG